MEPVEREERDLWGCLLAIWANMLVWGFGIWAVLRLAGVIES